MRFTYSYDPKLDLWAIMDNEFVFHYEVFKWRAVNLCRVLNKS
jgi:hypothetical protein